MSRIFTWGNWQRFCGWLAVAACIGYLGKSVIYASSGGYEILSRTPSLGTALDVSAAIAGILGPIALLGIAAPLVANWKPVLRVLASPVIALALAYITQFIFLDITGLAASDANWINFFGFGFNLVVALWLLRPTGTSTPAVLVGIGGLSLLANTILVHNSQPVEGWVVGTYQIGLLSALVGLGWLMVEGLREGRHLSVLSGFGVLVGVLALSEILPGGEVASGILISLALVGAGFRKLWMSTTSTRLQT